MVWNVLCWFQIFKPVWFLFFFVIVYLKQGRTKSYWCEKIQTTTYPIRARARRLYSWIRGSLNILFDCGFVRGEWNRRSNFLLPYFLWHFSPFSLIFSAVSPGLRPQKNIKASSLFMLALFSLYFFVVSPSSLPFFSRFSLLPDPSHSPLVTPSCGALIVHLAI